MAPGAAVGQAAGEAMPESSQNPDLGALRVLLVNDDGIEATGLKLLEKIVRTFTEDIWVVAPDEEKSGASHSLSLTLPVRVRRIDDRHFAIKGTPTDCALLAIWELMGDQRPTVLLSGINRGANLAAERREHVRARCGKSNQQHDQRDDGPIARQPGDDVRFFSQGAPLGHNVNRHFLLQQPSA
jgi:hypothetical protein